MMMMMTPHDDDMVKGGRSSMIVKSSHLSSNRCWYIDDEKGQDQTAIFGNDIKGRTRFTQKDLFMCKNIPEM